MSQILAPEIHAHYTDRWNESLRLSCTLKGELERTRVHEILTSVLPPAPARIVDIGGGPGVHAVWLQSLGYEVSLLDPVERHVHEASELGISSVTLGDARSLPWASGTFDAAIMFGPMYHLTNAADRRMALIEAARVVRIGGPVAAMAINRYANLIGSTMANQLRQRRFIVDDILRAGCSRLNDRMVPETYYHTPQGIRDEVAEVGKFGPLQTYGVTGPGGMLAVAIDRHFRDGLPATMREDDPLEVALACARTADQYPELLPLSSLLMVVGYRA